MRIGILGGTGPAGTALGARLASVGYEVVLGSRSRYRAMEARDDDPGARGRTGSCPSTPATTRTPPEADLVVIATPWDSAATTAHEHAPEPRGQGRREHGQRAGAGRVGVPAARAAPRLGGRTRAGGGAHCRVVAAFHHLPASELGHLDQPIDSDVLICSDDTERHQGRVGDRERHPRLPSARRRRAVQRHGHRGLHGRAAAAQRPLPDPGGARS